MVNDIIEIESNELSKDKLLTYIDICGTSRFYTNNPPIDQVAHKIGFGFLHTLDEIKDPNRLSIHIFSDSALLVPKDLGPGNREPITKNELVKISLKLFYKLLENTQGHPANLSRIFITKGTYYYIKYLSDGSLRNYTVGGNVLVKCNEADKKDGLPFGVFTDIHEEIDVIRKTPFSKWQFVDHWKYFPQTEYEILGLEERLLRNIIRGHFYGWDKTSVKLRQHCETLLSILKQN